MARLGGDEFAVLVEDAHDAEAAAVKVARRIMEAFVLPVGVGSESVAVYASVGIATSKGGDFSAEDLIRDADVAMYKAKSSGKGHFEVFHPSMGAAVLERHGLKEELRLAIERQELTLYFQPIVDLDTGELVAEEALVRWEHPRRGLVGPSEFVPLAEETGLILSLGQYVLEEACQQARRWQVQGVGDPGGRSDVAVHVNLSAVELRDPELVDRVRATLRAPEVDPRSLVFEITETVLLDESERVSAAIGELRELGARFALDDFGTGYSSLSYLHTLPFDMLKIAKSFVDGLARGGREAVVRAHDHRARAHARSDGDRRGDRDARAGRTRWSCSSVTSARASILAGPSPCARSSGSARSRSSASRALRPTARVSTSHPRAGTSARPRSDRRMSSTA